MMFKEKKKNGKYYFEYDMTKIETTELLDEKLVVHDKDFGYIYKSKLVVEYAKED